MWSRHKSSNLIGAQYTQRRRLATEIRLLIVRVHINHQTPYYKALCIIYVHCYHLYFIVVICEASTTVLLMLYITSERVVVKKESTNKSFQSAKIIRTPKAYLKRQRDVH